jgi:hypothetical protein
MVLFIVTAVGTQNPATKQTVVCDDWRKMIWFIYGSLPVQKNKYYIILQFLNILIELLLHHISTHSFISYKNIDHKISTVKILKVVCVYRMKQGTAEARKMQFKLHDSEVL